MQQFRDMTVAEQEAMDASLDTDGTKELDFDWRSPDGTQAIWDEVRKATVEITPDGRRYVVEIRDGRLTRVSELLEYVPPVAV